MLYIGPFFVGGDMIPDVFLFRIPRKTLHPGVIDLLLEEVSKDPKAPHFRGECWHHWILTLDQRTNLEAFLGKFKTKQKELGLYLQELRKQLPKTGKKVQHEIKAADAAEDIATLMKNLLAQPGKQEDGDAT